MAGTTIEPTTEMRGVRLKYEGLEIPGLYVRHKEMKMEWHRPRVLIFRNILSDAEAAVFKQESDWDYLMMAKDDIEMDCIFPSNDVVLYAFRSFLWQCPEGQMVTVRPDSFRAVIETFNLKVFKAFDTEHIYSQTPIYGAVPEFVGVRLFIDHRHINVGKPNDWWRHKPDTTWRDVAHAKNIESIPVRARYDADDYVVLLHEDWTVERVEKKR